MTSNGRDTRRVLATYPCSFAQEHLCRAEAVRPGDPAAIVSLRWKLTGELKQSTLQAAWNQLVVRHEMLRTRFEDGPDGYIQVVDEEVTFHIAVVDCSVLETSAVDEEVRRAANADARQSFDLSKAPLFRATRVIVDAATSILLVSAHRIICDGWSFGILSREMGQICDALQLGRKPRLAEVTTTFGTFARWQRGELRHDALSEELELLKSDFVDSRHFALPPDMPRPALWTSRVETSSRLLNSEYVRSFLNEARSRGATPFMAMLAATVLVLSERSTNELVTLSTQVACRDEVDIESVVGPVVNTIPLRFDVSGSPRLFDLVDRVCDVVANGLELRHVPFDCISSALFGKTRLSHGSPCDINFGYQRAFTADVTYSGFGIESEHSRPGGAFCDLNIYVVERPQGWRISCDYNPDLFFATTIDSLLDRIENVIARDVDARPPVLFFHSDLFAGGFYAEEVAAAIPEFRFVAMNPHGVEGLPMLKTIDKMADDIVERIGEVQPIGPYRLVGFCAGAQVAFEVALRLRKNGHNVDDLVLINATAPVKPVLPFRDRIIFWIGREPRIPIGLREAISYNVARGNRAVLQGPLAIIVFIARGISSLIGRQVGFGSVREGGESYVRRSADPQSELSLGHIAAVLAHHPHSYAGDMTLIWSSDQRSLTGEPTQGWNALARDVRVVPMSGGHIAPIHSLVGELSRTLRETLSQKLPSTLREEGGVRESSDF